MKYLRYMYNYSIYHLIYNRRVYNYYVYWTAGESLSELAKDIANDFIQAVKNSYTKLIGSVNVNSPKK
jgi:hypothetical protein